MVVSRPPIVRDRDAAVESRQPQRREYSVDYRVTDLCRCGTLESQDEWPPMTQAE